ncbi:MAG: NUDIX hydrolase [Vicinamibacterales bacterium]
MNDLKHWRTLTRQTVFSGGPIREVAVESVELPGGRQVDDYYVVRMPDYVLIFAEMRDGTVPLLRQYRHGPRRVCLTFPGGTIENRESPLEAAQRELLEELGCTADTWHSLGHYVTNANQGCNTAHLFRASGCVVTSAPHSHDLEDTEVEYMNRDALLNPSLLAEVGLVSHVALLLLATTKPDATRY